MTTRSQGLIQPPIDVNFSHKRKRATRDLKDKTTSPKIQRSSENVTPRRAAKRKLFDESPENENSAKSRPLRSKSTSRKSPLDDLVHVSRCLASSSGEIVGRVGECEQIKKFLNAQLSAKKPAFLYVSGVPGTGKTVCVTKIVNDVMNEHSTKIAFLNYNSMDFKPSKTIYSRLFNDLGGAKTNKSTSTLQKVEKLITSTDKMVVLVLDEIDKLLTKSADILYSLFDLTSVKDSKLILIGVANTLDLTQSSLTKLSAFAGKIVTKIYFKPYNDKDILNILNARLSKAPRNVFNPKSLILCAKTVSAHHFGDIRKALDICRQALELVERQNTPRPPPSPLRSSADDGFNPGSPRKSPKKEPAVKPENLVVDLIHMARVIGQFSSRKINVDDLTQQQMIVLCIVISFSTIRKLKEVDISSCHQIYIKTSQSKGLFNYSIPFESFLTMCNVLESKNLITIKYAKDHQKSKVSLAVHETELCEILKDKPFFKPMLLKIRTLV